MTTALSHYGEDAAQFNDRSGFTYAQRNGDEYSQELASHWPSGLNLTDDTALV